MKSECHVSILTSNYLSKLNAMDVEKIDYSLVSTHATWTFQLLENLCQNLGVKMWFLLTAF